jgi:hypothetical protein
VVLDKWTGRFLARRVGARRSRLSFPNSAPSSGVVNGKPLIFSPAETRDLRLRAAGGRPHGRGTATLKAAWRARFDPTAPRRTFTGTTNRRESPSDVFGMPVFRGDRVYVAAGGDLWWQDRRLAEVH